MKTNFKIGVFGSAAGNEIVLLKEKAFAIGCKVASLDGILVTGGCPGLPHAASLGAASKGGICWGFSPAMNRNEHIHKFYFPIEPYQLIFTGMEKKGRNIVSTRTCDAGIYISGRSGTLDEFLLIYDEGGAEKVIGLLTGSGGVVDNQILSFIDSTEKQSKTRIVSNPNPEELVEEIFFALNQL